MAAFALPTMMATRLVCVMRTVIDSHILVTFAGLPRTPAKPPHPGDVAMRVRDATYCAGFATLITIAACSDAGPVAPKSASVLAAPATIVGSPIPGSYIIVLKGDSTRTAGATRALTDRLIRLFGGRLSFRYEHALHGFAVDGLPDVVAVAIAKHPAVAYIEPNAIAPPSDGTHINPGVALDRIDQRSLPLDNSYSWTFDGAGAGIWIIDSGIDTTSGEFSRRVGTGYSCVGGDPYHNYDDFGHGTAVASVAAGTTHGVARGAIVHSVQISSRTDGYSSDALEVCGIDKAAQYLQNPAVVNMSYFGGAFSVRDAINNITGYRNVAFTKSAGNDAQDAYQDRGNRANYEIVVGGTDPASDSFYSFSDYGPTVTVLAPAVNVPVADKNHPFNPGLTASGTSFAAPMVAGVVAKYVAYCFSQPPTYYCGADKMRSLVLQNATPISASGLPSGTTNLFLYSNFFAF